MQQQVAQLKALNQATRVVLLKVQPKVDLVAQRLRDSDAPAKRRILLKRTDAPGALLRRGTDVVSGTPVRWLNTPSGATCEQLFALTGCEGASFSRIAPDLPSGCPNARVRWCAKRP